jgi:hypothetical protein
MSEVAQAGKTSSRAKAFFLVVLIFAVLGPAIGGLVFGLVMMGLTVGSSSSANVILVFFTSVLVTLMTALQWNNLLAPLVAGVTASAVATFLMQFVFSDFFFGNLFMIYLPICLVAALVCWYVTRKLVRSTWPSVAESAR